MTPKLEKIGAVTFVTDGEPARVRMIDDFGIGERMAARAAALQSDAPSLDAYVSYARMLRLRDALVARTRAGSPDFTDRQLALLLWLATEPGPHRVRGLAAALGVQKPVIDRAASRLAALGLVTRTRDPEDARDRLLEITRPGLSLVAERSRSHG